jgi:cytochrome c biogenesis protein CcdA
MLRLIGLAISIGIADSLNPTTIAPALYLASAGSHARRKVTEFTAAVFFVYLVGGAVIALGPGQLLLSALPRPNHVARHVIEAAAGGAMLIASVYLWDRRRKLSQKELPAVNPEGKSSALLGATITAIELPTAFPYFAVIAAIVGSDLDPARQLGVLLLFNVCFVGPLLGIIAILTFAPHSSGRMLTRARDWLQQHWPMLLAALLGIAGLFVVVLGVTGLAHRHVRIGRFIRRVPRLFR